MASDLTDRTRNLAGAAADRVRRERTAYDHEHEQPVAGYGMILGAFGGALACGAGVARLLGRRLPARVAPLDVLIGALAVQKAGRLLALDAVTSPLRAPFTRFEGATGSSELSEEVRAEGPRHAVGEMISCPFCMAPWLATAYLGGLVTAPRLTRVIAAALAVVALADPLQQSYDKLKSG